MKRGSRLVMFVAATATVWSAAAPGGMAKVIGEAEPSDVDPAVIGRWSAPFSEGGLFDERPPANGDEAKQLPAAVSMAVMPDGTVIYWNGQAWEDVSPSAAVDPPIDPGAEARVLDLRAHLQGLGEPTWSTPSPERGIGGSLFCGDLRQLGDGRLLVVGGTEYENLDGELGLPNGWGRTEARGLSSARVYDATTKTWTLVRSMNHPRWYPSLVTLADGRLFVAGGTARVVYNDLTYVNETETFDPRLPDAGWTDNGPAGETALPYYARLHLLPNGKVLYDASGQMWGPGGPTRDMAEWNVHKAYDPEENSWTELGRAPLGARSGSFSAMLPFQAPYDRARILVAGGTFAPATPGTYVANPVTEILEVTGDSIERRLGPPLNQGRYYSSGVVLPSGDVIAVNGGDKDDGMFPGTAIGVRQAEAFDGNRWTVLAASGRDRVYHNTAVLLGDGSVLVGGHAPITAFGGPGNANYVPGGVVASNFRDPSFEIFEPPYLFRGDRPRLTQVQAGVAPGASFGITTPDAAKITGVVLSRLPSVTHLADADQRTIELEHRVTSTGRVEATVPANPAVALPGHYYLFLMADNGSGPTPSRAAIVRVGETDSARAPLPFGI